MDNNVPDPSPSPQKHLLQAIWILWREGGNNRPSAETTADEWCTRLTCVTKLSSVEEFWKFSLIVCFSNLTVCICEFFCWGFIL